jgi:nucleoside-diphosphate-sugar epimerase
MKILLAGGAGYIGTVLTPKLLERGYEVDVVDLLWFGNHLPPEVNVVRRDIGSLTVDDLAGYDAVVFIAGLSNDPMADFSPSLNFSYNTAVPSCLAYTAKRAGVKRFIHGGSCSVYGYTVNELYDETSPAVSNYPYGIAKLQGEFGCLQMKDETFSVIAFRQGTVCGYSPRMRLDLVINTMFKSAVENKVITVNNPAIWRPILSIKDAAVAYVRALESPQAISGIFNIASGNYTVGELADYVKDGVLEYLGINAKIESKRIQDFRNYKVSTEKAQTLISFKARFKADDIVKDLAEHLNLFNDFNNDHYYNISIFKKIFVEERRSA